MTEVARCPHCSSEIAAGLDRCPHCEQELPQAPAADAKPLTVLDRSGPRFSLPTGWWKWAVAGVSVAIMLLTFVLWLQRPKMAPEWVGALSTSADHLTALQFSADGETLYIGGGEGQVWTWDLASNTPTKLESTSDAAILCLAESKDGVLVAGAWDHKLLGWQLTGPDAGKKQADLDPFDAPLSTLSINAKEAEVAIGLTDGYLYVLGGGKPFGEPTRHNGAAKSLAFSPDGNLLVTGGTDGRLIWRTAPGYSIKARVDAHDTEISALAFSPDGRQLATADWNGVLHLWNVKTREKTETLEQPDAISGLAWRNGTLVTSSWDGHLRIWNLDTKEVTHKINTKSPIQTLAVSAKKSLAATTSGSGTLHVWQLPP